jgi:TrmH family RNA methyltransferase
VELFVTAVVAPQFHGNLHKSDAHVRRIGFLGSNSIEVVPDFALIGHYLVSIKHNPVLPEQILPLGEVFSTSAGGKRSKYQNKQEKAGNALGMKYAFAHVQVPTINLVLQYMLSKAQSKHIRSLTQQKFRNEYRLFTAEGGKIAVEWLRSTASIDMVVATAGWADTHAADIATHPEATVHIVKETELMALSSLQTPNQVLLVIPYPTAKIVPISNEWYLALDDIQDPGNMGTIIRIADWFGIRHIICSPGCVDVYNPKVVQSSMGGHVRVNLYESELTEILPALPAPRYAAALNGKSMYELLPQNEGVLIIGNESKGISAPVMAMATQKVTIPRRGGAESLNASVAAGILCAALLPR